MKKRTLALLVPMYILVSQGAIASNLDESKPWSRDDVVKSVEALDLKREEFSKNLEDMSRKIMESRDGVKPIERAEDAAPKVLGERPTQTIEIKKSVESETKIVKTDGMTIEIKKREEKVVREPSISIEVSDTNATKAPSMIIEVKDKSAVPQPKVSMELVKIKKVEPVVVEKKSLYPIQLLKVKNHEE